MNDSRQTKSVGIILVISVAVFLTPLIIWQLTRDGPVSSLPPPDLTGHLGLSNALATDVIADELQGQPIGLADFSQLLWAMQGITSGGGLRAAPSAGGTYPLEIFVVANQVLDLDLGFYQYRPTTHSLREVNASESLTLVQCFGPDEGDVVAEAAAVFMVFAEYERTTQRYGPRGVHYVHLEVGHVLENALLQMASLSLRTKPLLVFNGAMMQELVNTTYIPLLVLPVGPTESTGPLTSPTADFDEMTVEQAIYNRRSLRDYTNTTLPGDSLSAILGNCTLAPLLESNASSYDLRVVLRDVAGLQSGLYDFHLANSSLALLSTEDLVEDLYNAGLKQPWIQDAQANLVISADFESACTHPDAELRWRAMLYTVGIMGQIVYLKCTSMGLGTVSIGGLYESQVAHVVQAPDGYTSLYIMPVGVL